MIKQHLPYLIMIGVATIFGIVNSLKGILNKEKISSSKYHGFVHILVSGILMGCLFLFYAFALFYWSGSMDQNTFSTLIAIGAIIVFFVSGMHGLLNRNKINNPLTFRFSRMSVVFSIIYAVTLIAMWLKNHK